MEEHKIELAQAKNSSGGADDALINKMAQDNLLGPQSNLMSFDKAPDSAMSRYGLVTVQGLENVPKGMLNAVVDDVKHPLQTLETVGTGAAIAVGLKTLLPEGGIAGKVAGAAIGAYFTFKAAEPVIDAYKKAGSAQTMTELNVAANQIGDAGGSFIINSGVAALGYKLGSAGAERALSSKTMDGFADAKANFYDKVGDLGSKLTDNLGITTPTEGPKLANSLSMKFKPSERTVPNGTIKGDVDPNTQMQVSVMLKSQASDLRVDRTLARIAEGRQAPLNDAQMKSEFGSSQESLDAVSKFAKANGLTVADSNLTTGRVLLKGTAGQFSNAFETKLSEYQSPDGVTFRGREGALSIPTTLADHITGVLGMDNRPQVRSYARIAKPAEATTGTPGTPGDPVPVKPRFGGGYLPTEVADAYNFPKDSMGAGQAVSIVELGGGIDMADNAQYYQDHSLKAPKINVIGVDGATNSPGGDADGEVLLDSQVIGAIAPDATQNLIFAPNSDQGFTDAILRGAFPENGEPQASAISISWGQNEEGWTDQAVNGMNGAFKKAALKGIAVFSASGDDGATDNAGDGTKQVDYPASDPYVTGSGGTTLDASRGKINSETAWSSGGGGVSQKFGPQDFQKSVTVPPNVNTGKAGRGVPDIAGNADPSTGYLVRFDGSEQPIGGTSAVSPLYSALMMRINGALGKPVPNLNAWLYKNPGIFNDVTSGDNGGYSAGPGYDAATGLGSIDGTKMLNALKVSPHVERTFGNYNFVGPPTFVGPATISSAEQQKH